MRVLRAPTRPDTESPCGERGAERVGGHALVDASIGRGDPAKAQVGPGREVPRGRWQRSRVAEPGDGWGGGPIGLAPEMRRRVDRHHFVL